MTQLSRRTVVKGMAAAGAVAAFPAIAACGDDDSSSSSGSSSGSSTSKGGGTVSFGSNASDAVPKKAYTQVFAGFTSKTKTQVKVNTVDHNTFQEQINSYLQGRPDDVFTWFAGYRMQFFAQKGLARPIDDVWQTLKPFFPPALQAASRGLDGHYYFVPIYNYPWVVMYRKS